MTVEWLGVTIAIQYPFVAIVACDEKSSAHRLKSGQAGHPLLNLPQLAVALFCRHPLHGVPPSIPACAVFALLADHDQSRLAPITEMLL
jgi:hypothetical protein